MKVFERYFEQNKLFCRSEFPADTSAIVIIPVLNDRDIFKTLDSLVSCTPVKGHTGIIIIVNHGENCCPEVKRANIALAEELTAYASVIQHKSTFLCVEIIKAFDLPAKYAGVGLARKIAMDVAVDFFYRVDGVENPVISLDADTLVDKNYLDAVISCFRESQVAGISIAYAHRLDEPDCQGAIREAMVKYELYLRYYQLALAYTGHPYAYHCIGSAFAVRARDYVAQGGMNRRQAGEDFYFLQKLIATGRYASPDTTRVYPSSRFSERTPFGTGQSVRQIVENGGIYPVYHFEAFRQLKGFFSDIIRCYKADKQVICDYTGSQSVGLKNFLEEIKAGEMIQEVNANCASEKQFLKRFYDHFNAFRVLKYLNYVHEEFFQKTDVVSELQALCAGLGLPCREEPVALLEFLRNQPAFHSEIE